MALPELHPVNEAVVFAHPGQIGATPAAAYARVPFRGKVSSRSASSRAGQ